MQQVRPDILGPRFRILDLSLCISSVPGFVETSTSLLVSFQIDVFLVFYQLRCDASVRNSLTADSTEEITSLMKVLQSSV